MRPLISGPLFAVLLVATPSANADKLERPTIVTTAEGRDLRITVRGVTDYCATDADTQILRTRESIRILRDRPYHASKCISTQSLSFLVKDVGPGRYAITYERMPLVAPARPRTVAFATVFVAPG